MKRSSIASHVPSPQWGASAAHGAPGWTQGRATAPAIGIGAARQAIEILVGGGKSAALDRLRRFVAQCPRITAARDRDRPAAEPHELPVNGIVTDLARLDGAVAADHRVAAASASAAVAHPPGAHTSPAGQRSSPHCTETSRRQPDHDDQGPGAHDAGCRGRAARGDAVTAGRGRRPVPARHRG